MIIMAEEINELTQCSVCFESYDENGDHIPRILPCHCTLCQSCIGQLIKNNVLECPQDRAKHAANRGVKSFSQNKYIITYLKRELKPKESDYEECSEHKLKIVLFCKDVKCQKRICPMCMSEKHLTHQVVNILDEEKNELYEKLNPLLETLNRYNDTIIKAKQQIEEDCEDKVKLLMEKKQEVLVELDDKLTNSLDNLVTLVDIKEKISKEATHSDLVDKMDFVKIMEELCAEARNPVKFEFYELHKNQQDVSPSRDVLKKNKEVKENATVQKETKLCVKEGNCILISDF